MAIAAFAAIAIAAFAGVRRLLPPDGNAAPSWRQVAGREQGERRRGSRRRSPLPPVELRRAEMTPAIRRHAAGYRRHRAAPQRLGHCQPFRLQTLAAAEPWLKPLNYYRELAGLTPVAPDPALAAGDVAHSRYLVENDTANIKAGVLGRREPYGGSV